MFEEARLPLVDPDFYKEEEAQEVDKLEDEQRVLVLEISPKNYNEIEI